MESVLVNQDRASALQAAVTRNGSETDALLRAAALERAGGGAPIDQPRDELARQIGEAAYKVTDAQVAAVREATGSDKAAFEIIMSACIGAGLARWGAAVRAIEEARDAAP
ncbi:hypothetical protein ACFOYW_02280 [Gryllotalpicola reticulitermitis]|uniref:Carboxymuconolactone decarboxylase family protein n=1 Tax=Gryllotalpicola reticulitermitis TaxID=1184153 RepID=A0ABV8Q138_9MICO